MTSIDLAEAPRISAPRPIRQMLSDCEKIGKTSVDDTHRIASLLQEMILNYYADVRLQAQQSFRAALAVATVGVLFFGYAVWVGMSSGTARPAYISAGAGALIQVISGINFYLYARAARQFGAFHVCLERTNRFLLANSLCEKLDAPYRDEMRAELTRLVANAPMLTVAILEGADSHPGMPHSRSRKTSGISIPASSDT